MRQAKTLSPVEFKRVLASTTMRAHSERNQMALRLSYFAGLRVKEIASLSVQDVLNSNGSVKEIVLLGAEKTKGQKGRKIVFNSVLCSYIEEYLEFLSAESLLKPTQHLIYSQKRGGFSPNALCQMFTKIYKDAAVDGATSHSGRRTYISTLSHKGISAKVLMELAGHKNLSTTQRYIEVTDLHLKSAADLIKI